MRPGAAEGGAVDPGPRLDRLPSCRAIWAIVLVVSTGAFFEIYDIFLTPVISPALARAGIFRAGGGFSDQARFIAATFLGLWAGTLLFAGVADRFGRKPTFLAALVAYAAATFAMGLQSTSLGVDLWRLAAGIGVGVQLVVIDCYLAELTPPAIRGRAFAVSSAVQFLAAPASAFLALAVVGHRPLGVDGWRWLAWPPAFGAVLLLALARLLPESPRWLARRGRHGAAARTLRAIEAKVEAQLGRRLPAPHRAASPPVEPTGASLWRPPYRRRTAMMALFHLLQSVGYYGFANWAPTFLETRGVGLAGSFAYAVVIGLSYPLAPLLIALFADRLERKWQVVLGAGGSALVGLLFAAQTGAAGWIIFGFLLAFANSLMSIGFHAYQAELFPTSIRSGAVGFVYSFSRLSAAFSGFLIAFLLSAFGVAGVFAAIAAMLLLAAALIALLGPATGRRSLESVSPA